MTPYRFRWTHATACSLAALGVAYQSAIIWETLTDVTTIVKLGIPLATISAALLPVMAEASWRSGARGKALALLLPVAVLLAFVLPSGVSRLGEAQSARVMSASISGASRSQIEDNLRRAEKLVAQSESWVATECASGRGDKCRGQQFTLEQRVAFRDKLQKDLVGTAVVVAPWLPAWHSALLLIGIELSVSSMLFYGLGPVTPDRRLGGIPAPVALSSRPVVAITERDFESEPLTEDELAELKRVLGGDGLMNKTLAARLGLSEGQTSKLVAAAVEAGKLSKAVDPSNRRAVIIRAA